MQLAKHTDLTDGSSCTLYFEEPTGWLRAVWLGYIDPIEAYNGAERFLQLEQVRHCAFLLNDNSGISGPWFDSMEWLSRVWIPAAVRLGLRYVAHVPQPASLMTETAALAQAHPVEGLDIQVFDTVAEAEQWLHEMQAAMAT